MIELSKSFGKIYREAGVFSQPYSNKVRPNENPELFERKGSFYFPRKSFSQELARELVSSENKFYSKDLENNASLIGNLLFYSMEEANGGNFDLDFSLQIWKGDFANFLSIKSSVPEFSYRKFLNEIKNTRPILKERDFRNYFNKNTIISSERGGLVNVMYRFPKKK
jgi:hypothetical protein